MRHGKTKTKNKKKTIIIVIIIIVALLAAAAAGVYVFGKKYVMKKLDKIDYVALDSKDLAINDGVEENLKDYRNILLLGIDSREGESVDACRSDANVIISINKKTNKINVISVVRDSYLDIDEVGQKKLDKLTHAHAYGGPINTIRTLNRALDLNIKEYARVNWQTVADLTDCLGGVTVNVKDYEIDEMNKYIRDTNKSLHGETAKIKKAGKQQLNGVQAVTYCRIRHVGNGDEERAERMRTVLKQLSKKATHSNIKTLNKTADTVLPEIQTNIKKDSLFDLMLKSRKFKIDKMGGWPFQLQGAMIGGVSYDVPVTLESNVKKMYKKYFGIKDYVPTDVVIEMSNRICAETGLFDLNSTPTDAQTTENQGGAANSYYNGSPGNDNYSQPGTPTQSQDSGTTESQQPAEGTGGESGQSGGDAGGSSGGDTGTGDSGSQGGSGSSGSADGGSSGSGTE